MNDYIDPSLGLSVALILWGVYIIIRVWQSKRTGDALVRIQHTQAVIQATQVYGNNPNVWPSEVRDALGVES